MDENMSKGAKPGKAMAMDQAAGIEGETPMWKSWKFWLIVVLAIVVIGGLIYWLL